MMHLIIWLRSRALIGSSARWICGACYGLNFELMFLERAFFTLYMRTNSGVFRNGRELWLAVDASINCRMRIGHKPCGLHT
jgi:hypothetical protein